MVKITTTGSVPELNVEAFQKEIAQEMLRRVRQRTPVQSSELQNAYNVEINKNDINISNDKDYFWPVEDGTVHKTGVHMMRTTVEELPQIVEDNKNKLIKGH